MCVYVHVYICIIDYTNEQVYIYIYVYTHNFTYMDTHYPHDLWARNCRGHLSHSPLSSCSEFLLGFIPWNHARLQHSLSESSKELIRNFPLSRSYISSCRELVSSGRDLRSSLPDMRTFSLYPRVAEMEILWVKPG